MNTDNLNSVLQEVLTKATREEIPDALGLLESWKARFHLRLIEIASKETNPPQHKLDEFLTVEDVAKILKVEPHWLYSHAKTLPFARKLSRKRLRFKRLGLEKWMATRR